MKPKPNDLFAIGALLLLLVSCKSIAPSEPMEFVAVVPIPDGRGGISIEEAALATMRIDEAEGVVAIEDGSMEVVLTNCSDERWYCLSAGFLEFAIEKQRNPDTLSWSHRGTRFDVMQTFPGRGKDRIVYVKATGDGERPAEIYVYSEREGLLQFMWMATVRGEPVPVTYVRTR